MNNFYISDLHFGHANIIRFDNRPFASVEEMNEVLTQNWNNIIGRHDNVYILGDLIWDKENVWRRYLKWLNGKKFLICGNHDPRQFSADTKRFFMDITNYKEVSDCDKRVIMCHYPIPFHKRAYDPNTWMLYGHVHTTREEAYLETLRKQIVTDYDGMNSGRPCGHFVNVGCMMSYMAYKPRSLEEIIAAHNAKYSTKE